MLKIPVIDGLLFMITTYCNNQTINNTGIKKKLNNKEICYTIILQIGFAGLAE